MTSQPSQLDIGHGVWSIRCKRCSYASACWNITFEWQYLAILPFLTLQPFLILQFILKVFRSNFGYIFLHKFGNKCRFTSDQLAILLPFSVISGRIWWFWMVISVFCGTFQKILSNLRSISQSTTNSWTNCVLKHFLAVLGQCRVKLLIWYKGLAYLLWTTTWLL